VASLDQNKVTHANHPKLHAAKVATFAVQRARPLAVAEGRRWVTFHQRPPPLAQSQIRGQNARDK